MLFGGQCNSICQHPWQQQPGSTASCSACCVLQGLNKVTNAYLQRTLGANYTARLVGLADFPRVRLTPRSGGPHMGCRLGNTSLGRRHVLLGLPCPAWATLPPQHRPSHLLPSYFKYVGNSARLGMPACRHPASSVPTSRTWWARSSWCGSASCRCPSWCISWSMRRRPGGQGRWWGGGGARSCRWVHRCVCERWAVCARVAHAGGIRTGR